MKKLIKATQPAGIVLTRNGIIVFEKNTVFSTESLFYTEIVLKGASDNKEEFSLTLMDSKNQELVSYTPE